MWHYCGCREIPLIKDFIAEHESATNLAGGIIHALEHDQAHTARPQLETLARELASHWRGEETGLFAVMRGNPEFTDYIDQLEAEHREPAALMGAVDLALSGDRTELAAALGALHQHIVKEKDVSVRGGAAETLGSRCRFWPALGKSSKGCAPQATRPGSSSGKRRPGSSGDIFASRPTSGAGTEPSPGG